jgi:stromal membrane-associated protein
MKDLRSKANDKAEILNRLKQCLAREENKICSECPEPNPTWASLLVPPVELKKELKKEKHKDKKDKVKTTRKMGVFCCYKCCSYHFQLGRQVCEVKNIKVADDCKFVQSIMTSRRCLI